MRNVSGGREIVEFVSSGGKTKGILSLDEFFLRIWPLDNPKKPSIMGEKVRRAYMTLTERALLHEKSYPRVGFSPLFFPRRGDLEPHFPWLSKRFLGRERESFPAMDGYDFS
jgi:hypothetical protein